MARVIIKKQSDSYVPIFKATKNENFLEVWAYKNDVYFQINEKEFVKIDGRQFRILNKYCEERFKNE